MVRDPLDYVEFHLETRKRLWDIRSRVLNGRYEPNSPNRLEAAKGGGAYRVITIPVIEDLIVYRLLADEVYRLARKRENPNAFFSRKHGLTPVGEKVDAIDSEDYVRFFEVWKRYNQYRSRTLLSGLYDVLVIADIATYFDSIQHSLLIEYLMPLGMAREATGLLAKLLLALRPQAGFSPTPTVGIPLDEFDCSRQLAHVFLFDHDSRVVDRFGERNYVRWMDDQNIGARGYTEARQVVYELTSSLSDQRLTLNSGKTRFLSPSEVAEYFHLSSNNALDDLEERIMTKQANRATLVGELTALWAKATSLEGKGNWDKILKRFYSLASMLRSPLLVGRTYEDLVRYPYLAKKIFEYFIARSAYVGLADLFDRYVATGECLYESVALAFFEVVLGSDPPGKARRKLRDLSRRVLTGDLLSELGSYPKQSAALCLYWLGDGRSVRTMRVLLAREGHELPEGVARALLAGALCLDPDNASDTLSIAVRAGKSGIASIATLLSRLQSGQIGDVPGSKIVHPRLSWALQREIYDARMWLRLELIAFGTSGGVADKLWRQVEILERANLSSAEERCLSRLKKRL